MIRETGDHEVPGGPHWAVPDGEATGEHARRRPEHRLTTGRIVTAAIGIADADGLGSLTMRATAGRLGVTTMSLYRYVQTKAELLSLMVDTAYGGTVVPFAGAHWRDRIWELACADWRIYHRHPWLLQVSEHRAALRPNVIASFDTALTVLDGSGLGGSQQTSTLSLVNHFVRGAANDSIEEARFAAESGMDIEQWWAEHYPEFARRAASGSYPALARLLAEEEYTSPEDSFTFGLERICDGIQSLVDNQRAGAPAGRRCLCCGAPVARAATGRPRDYCSPACRQRAYRSRTA